MRQPDVAAIDHVQLAAPPGCEDRARAFFGDLLQLEELPKPPPLAQRGGVWFALGSGQQLHVGVDPGFSPARKAHPALAVVPAALDSLARALAAAGHPVRWDEELPERRRFYTEDPWGNRLELVEARAQPSSR